MNDSRRGRGRDRAGRILLAAALAALGLATAATSVAASSLADVLAASTPADWRPLDPESTLCLEFAAGRVVIELAPAFAPEHVANIRTLVRQGWLAHCYGMVGVGRGNDPGSGSGAELYVVIGHAPRHLDRNIAVVGRVVSGIEHLSILPRGSGPLGFYERPEQYVPIVVRPQP